MATACACVLLGADRAPIVQPALGAVAWSTSGIAVLDADIDTLVNASPALRGSHYGIYAIETATGNVLYARAADDEFQPASTLKLVVGSTALDRLTPSFSWKTSAALSPGRRVENGPDLVLTLTGDPTLATSDLEDAIAQLPAADVESVLVDDSQFDDVPYAKGWTWDDFGEDYAPSVSAATLDENVIEMRVTPAARAGDPASVAYADGRGGRYDVSGCDASAGTHIEVIPHVTTGPPASEDTVDATQTPGRCPEIVGSIPLGAAPETIGVSIYRPIVNVRDTLLRLLDARKIPVTEAVRPRVIDGAAPLRPYWTHVSKPLAEVLGPRFWIPSDNLFAELLLKELGLADGGTPGTTDKGIAVEKAWLASIGVDPSSVTLADGCGMSQYDRITPRDLVTILQHDWNGPNRQLVLDSLPVGGARGTIEGIAGTPAAGRTFAKTGSMMHVRGLAGYLATQRHGAVTFAFQVDDWNGEYPALAALRAQVLSRIVADPS